MTKLELLIELELFFESATSNKTESFSDMTELIHTLDRQKSGVSHTVGVILQDFLGDVPQVLLPINTATDINTAVLKFGVRIPFLKKTSKPYTS